MHLNRLTQYLSGGDLRSIGKSEAVAAKIRDQASFDKLFHLLFHPDRAIAMRSADACEKITRLHQSFLQKHKKEILLMAAGNEHIEVRWHMALLVARLRLNSAELKQVSGLLLQWAKDTQGSKIVRVNALQALFELTLAKKFSLTILNGLMDELQKEGTPSLNARIRKLRGKLATLRS